MTHAFRRLTDAQVTTLMHILIYIPDVPKNLDRFPTVRMMLETGMVQQVGDKLFFNTKCPENLYQYVVPANYLDGFGGDTSFADLEKSGKLVFNPSAEPRLVPEDNNSYRNRLVEMLPEGAVNSAEEIGNASTEDLDAIGDYLKCKRIPADTFYFYDVLILCQQLEELGGELDIDNNQIKCPDGNNGVIVRGLVDAFQEKYPRTKSDVPATESDFGPGDVDQNEYDLLKN